MSKKSCENVDNKRDLLYSFSTLVFIPILNYFAVTSAFTSLTRRNSSLESSDHGVNEDDGTSKLPETSSSSSIPEKLGNGTFLGSDMVIDLILQRRELPFETVLYIVLIEMMKLVIVFTIFPGSHLFDQTPALCSMWKISSAGGGSASGVAGGGKYLQGRLPFSKRDRDRENGSVKSPSCQIKLLELWKGLCNYVIGCLVCHILIILLGGPILENFKVTFQFSVILTTWLLAPMCLAVQPSRLLQEIMFISLWNSENEILHRTKCRFILTVLGAWIGAVVIPLDWDRPWQKWPIPCLISTFLIFLVSNLVLTIHLLCVNFGIYQKLSLMSTESNKVKNF